MKTLRTIAVLAALISTGTVLSQTQTNEINSTGKVGIGTMSPTETLEVNGTTKIDGEMIVKDSVTVDKNMTIKQDVKVKGTGTFTGLLKAKSDLKILGTTKMKGNAFVEGTFKFKGLADPAATDDRFLIINNNGKAKSLEKAGILANLYAPSPCLALPSGGIGAIWQQGSNPTYGILYTGDPCEARVGIGISTPGANLHNTGTTRLDGVVGFGVAQNLAAQVFVEPTDPSRVGLCLRMENPNDFNYGFKALTNNDKLKALAVNRTDTGKDVFRVMGDGLVVATEIRVREVNDFPDYVFESNYDLLSLDSLETYIETEKHLPNVPTATEVQENGIGLGEMNRVLVEKVEELTLYIIQQNNRINAQQEELEELRQLIQNK